MFTVTSTQPRQPGSLQRIRENGSTPHDGVAFFTPGLRRGGAVNVILYLHGNMFGGFEDLRGKVLDSVAAAGKPLAFAMPSLENAPSGASWIGTQANFDSFLDGVLLAAAQQINEDASGKCLVDRDQEWNAGRPTGNRVTAAPLGNLVIAAHSGGGFPMWTVVNNRSSKINSLSELWFLDCLYGTEGSWIPWARRNGSITMEIIYTVFRPAETGANSARAVGRAAVGPPRMVNVRAVTQEPTNDHNKVPPNNIGRLIRVSSNL